MENKKHIYEDSDIKRATSEPNYVHLKLSQETDEIVFSLSDLQHMISLIEAREK